MYVHYSIFSENTVNNALIFYNLPFSASRVNPELLVQFAQIVGQAKKPILLYCRSGARSTAIYRMAVEAGYLDPEKLSLISD